MDSQWSQKVNVYWMVYHGLPISGRSHLGTGVMRLKLAPIQASNTQSSMSNGSGGFNFIPKHFFWSILTVLVTFKELIQPATIKVTSNDALVVGILCYKRRSKPTCEAQELQLACQKVEAFWQTKKHLFSPYTQLVFWTPFKGATDHSTSTSYESIESRHVYQTKLYIYTYIISYIYLSHDITCDFSNPVRANLKAPACENASDGL